MAVKMLDIDDELWHEFKIKCFNENQITIKAKLTQLIKAYVKGE